MTVDNASGDYLLLSKNSNLAFPPSLHENKLIEDLPEK